MPINNIEEKVQWFKDRRYIYEALSKKAELLIAEILDLNQVSYHSIEARCKSIESYRNKIEKNIEYEDKYKEMQDLTGVRIIGYVNSDIENISEIIKANFEIDNDKSIDKTTLLGADKVGYRSMHYVVTFKKSRSNLPEFKLFDDIKFEIQVRTILQHAWAAIEHDRNYKFSGILPKHIDRKFKLLAGLLEIADNEFNQIAEEIDKYSINVSEKTKSGELTNIPINSTSLIQYFKDFFNEDKNILFNFGPPDKDYSKLIIYELESFGIKTLADLDKINSKLIKDVYGDFKTNTTRNIMGIIRAIMIKNDPNKYFKNAWKRHWNTVSDSTKYKKIGVDIDSLGKKYGFTVHSNQ